MSDNDGKLKISWDDIESVPEQSSQSQIQDMSGGESWGQVNPTHAGGAMSSSSTGSVFYKSWFCLGAAGLVASAIYFYAAEQGDKKESLELRQNQVDDEPQSKFYYRTENCDICGGGGIKFGESSDKWHYQNCPRYSKPTSFDFFPEL